ncbi:MAG: hypothetical protein BWY83_01822 [bacterium ADurb.Bin478]|nr:MAG: hypothetical protein BWY83_01822 [bacterium ADurb.Bin478]
MLGEIGLAGQFYAVYAGAEIDLVDIGLKDFLFAELLFNLQRDQCLLDLAQPGSVKTEKKILGQLLGDGAAALPQRSVQQVVNDGTDESFFAETMMPVKTGVLQRDRRLQKDRRDPMERNHLAIGQRFDDTAVVAIDHRGRVQGNLI